MARSKWLLLTILIGMCLSACGNNMPSVSPAGPVSSAIAGLASTTSAVIASGITTTSPSITPATSILAVATAHQGDPIPNFYYYVAETSDSGTTWGLLMNEDERSGKKTSNSFKLNCLSLKTCFNLQNIIDPTSTKFFDIIKEGSNRWKNFFSAYPNSYFSCINATECWKLRNDGSYGEITATKTAGPPWTTITSQGSIRVNASNEQNYLKSRRDDKIESEFAFIHSISCVSSSYCVTVGQGRSIRTLDGGQTWDWFATDPSLFFKDSVCFDESNCYGFGRDFIDVTHNFGETWQQFNLPEKSKYSNLRGKSCPTISFCVVGGDRGYFLTTNDKGATWSKRPLAADISMEDVSCPDNNVCYAVMSDASLLVTRDAGKTWSSKLVELENFDGYNARISCPSITNCLISYKKLDYN
jgi:hypothetical protein